MRKLFIALTLTVCFIACKDNKPKDCPSGKPLPIFTKEMFVVKDHSFNAQGQKSQEEVGLANGTRLEIFQQGCDTLSQSFRFSFSHLITRDSFVTTIDSAISQFRYLSAANEKLKPFVIWSDALTQLRTHIRQGEYLDLDRGIKLRIDQLDQGSGTTIVLDVMQISSTH